MSAALMVPAESWPSSTEGLVQIIDAQVEANLKNLLRIVVAPDEASERVLAFPATDWGPLIERLRDAGRHSRAIEVQAQEQDARVQQVLEHVHEDVREANERVRIAEAKVRDAQVRAEAQVMIAEERAAMASARADAAEARARTAEQWLVQVQETIIAEFTSLPV